MKYLFILFMVFFDSCGSDGNHDDPVIPPVVTPPIENPSTFLSATDLSFLPMLESKNINPYMYKPG